MYIREGDTVIVLTGSDRKKTGVVKRVLHDRGAVIVSGVNVRVVHRKPQTRGEKGSREQVEKPIHLSNVSLLDPKDKKATRVGVSGTGLQKKRIARRSGTAIPIVSRTKASKAKRAPVASGEQKPSETSSENTS